MGGFFVNSIDFGENTPTLTGSPIPAAFVAKLAGNGDDSWSKGFVNSSVSQHCLAVDGSDHVMLSGDFTGNVDFGGGSLSSAGQRDIFVAQWDASGAHVASARYGGLGDQYGGTIGVSG